MNSVLNALRLPRWSVATRLLLINGLLMAALVVVTVIAWRAISAQSRAMAELALISKAARYHQDADTVHANLRADVNAVLASGTLSADERSSVAASLADNATRPQTPRQGRGLRPGVGRSRSLQATE